jgi:hypothetical protein
VLAAAAVAAAVLQADQGHPAVRMRCLLLHQPHHPLPAELVSREGHPPELQDNTHKGTLLDGIYLCYSTLSHDRDVTRL